MKSTPVSAPPAAAEVPNRENVLPEVKRTPVETNGLSQGPTRLFQQHSGFLSSPL